jgi:dipeptidyl aminopeptidase/acylaminoacyl peptidase
MLSLKRQSLVFLAPLLVSQVLTGAQPFTLEQIMSAPFASSLLASPSGARVAWLINEQGRRNLWVAAAPEWKGHKVTDFREDDGQEIDNIAWAHDCSFMVFSRGGDFEMGRENPNPAIAAQKPDQSVWRVDLDGKPARKLTEGHSPVPSPNGDWIAFIKTGQLQLMKSDGTGVVQAAAQLGSVEELSWSPDGASIAFVSDRRDHRLIGVYDVAGKSIEYLDPSVDRDGWPVWSPSGNEIAFVRIPVSTRAFDFGPEREGEPWSIRVVEVKTGVAREVFHASKGPGSLFHPVAAARQIFWSQENLIFPWERNGWCHLYSVSSHGGEPVELTRGDGEVEHVAASPDGAAVYYSTNIGNIDGRDVNVIDLRKPAGAPARINRGGFAWTPAPVADGSGVAYLASSERDKSHAVISLAGSAAKDLAPETVPPDYPAAALVKPEVVIFTSADGLPIHGQLFLPPAGAAGSRRPALLFFHGGSRRQMLPGFHYMYYYSNAYAMNQYLASRGYIVLSVNYRSGIGYGLNFREAEHYGATGASEYNDVVGAALYMKSRPDVDPKRLGLWGGSYGGYLTALGLARASDLFAAGVDFHGVHDWNDVIRNFVPAYNAQKDADAARIAFESSPLASVKDWKSPVLLIHGDDDRNVPFSQTVRLVEALRQQGVPFEQIVFPNEIHDFLLHRDWVKAYHATADFLDRKLK